MVFGGGATPAYGYQFANATACAARLDDPASHVLRRELLARVRALLRRSAIVTQDGTTVTTASGLKIDAATGLEITQRTPETGPGAH